MDASVTQQPMTEPPNLTPAERRLREFATHGSPPAHEWQPVALEALALLAAIRQASAWDVCTICGQWAEARDGEGRGVECCAVSCAGCGEFVEGKFAEECDRDADHRPICDACAVARDEANEDERRIGMAIRRREARGWPTGEPWTP